LSQYTHLTDRRTDRIATAIPCIASVMQSHSKNDSETQVSEQSSLEGNRGLD